MAPLSDEPLTRAQQLYGLVEDLPATIAGLGECLATTSRYQQALREQIALMDILQASRVIDDVVGKDQ